MRNQKRAASCKLFRAHRARGLGFAAWGCPGYGLRITHYGLRILLACFLPLVAGCSCEDGRAAGVQPLPGERPERKEERGPKNPLAFTAPTLDGETFDLAARNARRRLVVYLFDPTAAQSDVGTSVAARLHAQRLPHNLEVVAVAVPPGYTPLAAQRVPPKRPSAAQLAELARAHLMKQGAELPCVPDPDGAIVERYTLAWGTSRLDQLPAFYPFERGALDSLRPVFPRYAERSPEPADYLARRVLARLGIQDQADLDPALGDRPPAPQFTVKDLKGISRSLRDYAGGVLVLTLWARDCPRCKDLLLGLAGAWQRYGPHARSQGPTLNVLAVATDLTGDALAALAAERGYPFPVAGDPDWALRAAFRYRGTVPDTFIIGPDGTIRFRQREFTQHTPALLETQLALLLGLPIKPLLQPGIYNGDQACQTCHARQHADWSLTPHACAWESLVRIGREADPKCVRCHVTGHHDGAFASAARTPHLTAVQCEACHGPAGCRAFAENLPPRIIPPDGLPQAEAKIRLKPEACLFCHDATHSPRFDFAAYRRRVLHDQRAEILKLPREEREARLQRTCAGQRDNLFDPLIPYIGAAACGKCHPTEYAALRDTPHARALDRLAAPAPIAWSTPRHKRGRTGLADPACLRCHTTGYGRPGGYPAVAQPPPAAGAQARAPVPHPMAGVTCEACHGPGKAHADDPKKPGAILRLAGGCPECSVLPICRTCHDDANDPDFDPRIALHKARHPIGKAIPKP